MIDDCSRGDLVYDALKGCLKLLENYGKHTFTFEDYQLNYVMKIGIDAGMNTVLYIEVEKNIDLHIWVPISHMAIQLLINCKVMSYWHTVSASPLSIVVTHCPEMHS